MPNTPDVAWYFPTAPDKTELLPASPFYSVRYHFGMLLGVDDFETDQAYHRGKTRLHNAWLHREGVVWGLNVSWNKQHELQVDPGLALDAAGNELHLDGPACVNIGKWFAQHRKDAGFNMEEGGDGARTFTIHVVARFKACLTRPVPALAEPCAGAESDTAYSRVFETVELLIRPGNAPERTLPYRRLRILFQIEKDDDTLFKDVRLRRESIQALPLEEQPMAYLKAFREFAAFDVIDLSPQRDPDGDRNSIFPHDPAEVVLAEIRGIAVKESSDSEWNVTGSIPTVDVTVRPSHVATSTIQELLCGPLFTISAGGNTGVALPEGTPTIDPESVTMTQQGNQSTVTLTVSHPLQEKSVTKEAVAVIAFDTEKGWVSQVVTTVAYNQNQNRVVMTMKSPLPTDKPIRLIVRGTGDQPILGKNFVPLGNGQDFVFVKQPSTERKRSKS